MRFETFWSNLIPFQFVIGCHTPRIPRSYGHAYLHFVIHVTDAGSPEKLVNSGLESSNTQPRHWVALYPMTEEPSFWVNATHSDLLGCAGYDLQYMIEFIADIKLFPSLSTKEADLKTPTECVYGEFWKSIVAMQRNFTPWKSMIWLLI